MLKHAEKAGEPHALSCGLDDESRFERNPQTYVHPTATGRHVFVGVAERDMFDAIALPCVDHGPNKRGHVLTKMIETDGCTVMFQHWIKSLTAEAYIADVRERRAAGELREHQREPGLGNIGEGE